LHTVDSKMTSQSSQSSKSSSKSNRSGFNIDEGNTGSGSSNKQRFSSVYQYFTFDESKNRWNCDYCE